MVFDPLGITKRIISPLESLLHIFEWLKRTKDQRFEAMTSLNILAEKFLSSVRNVLHPKIGQIIILFVFSEKKRKIKV